MAAGEHCGGLRARYVDPLTYVSAAEFVDDPEVISRLGQLSPTAEIHEALLTSSAWCDEYAGTKFVAHRHIEYRVMRPDPEGRLIWLPEHGPLIALESLTFGLTTYTSPLATVLDERSVVVDLSSITASWVGALQFGAPTQEMDAVWRYTAGYQTMPVELLRAVVLYGIFLVSPDADLIIEAQRCLDPYRWTH